MKPNTPKLLERRGGLPPGRLRRVTDYLEGHLERAVSLRTMAELVHMSPYHFGRLFKQSTGLSPHQYLLRQRIRKATQLLEDDHLPIREISRRVGFGRPAHFTTAFRKVVGIAPSKYRLKQVKSPTNSPGLFETVEPDSCCHRTESCLVADRRDHAGPVSLAFQ